MRGHAAPIFILTLLAAGTAHADVKISSAATANMACSNGVCSPTAKYAVLNAGDLESLLASGNVEVTTTGSGVQADNIRIEAPLEWSGTNTLVLDAYESLLVESSVSIAGQGDLSVIANDGGKNGYFGFLAKGHVNFANLSSALTINGASYTLEGDIQSLATAIAANPTANYALAGDYNASKDKTYKNSPITTGFSGNFEGLGNSISQLSIRGTGNINDNVGLFAVINFQASVVDVSLKNFNIMGNGPVIVGSLAGVNSGTIRGAFAEGSMSSQFNQGGPLMGGLVGDNSGTISLSAAAGPVTTDAPTTAGGLVGGNGGLISQSFANSNVKGGDESAIGGLAGLNTGSIDSSYAVGSVTDSTGSFAGGLVSDNGSESSISQSYSTTALKDTGRKNHEAGGLIGVDNSPGGSNTADYWDTSTSHIRKQGKGAGKPKNDPGITGLTTEQLQSGLPSGFDPTVWAEDPKINGGFPYLINNPPRKD